MSSVPNSSSRRTVERHKDNCSPLSASIAPTVGDSYIEDCDDPQHVVTLDDDESFLDLDWERVPHLERRQGPRSLRGSKPSWIYKYGWPVFHRKHQKNYWLCRYCHVHRRSEASYDVSTSTSSAGSHLSKLTRGHSVGPNSPITKASREGNIRGAIVHSQVYQMRKKGVEVSQEVANELAASFSRRRFEEALKDWVQADN